MPLVIHELIVTAETQQTPQSKQQAISEPPLDKEELIRECVEEVIKQLARERER